MDYDYLLVEDDDNIESNNNFDKTENNYEKDLEQIEDNFVEYCQICTRITVLDNRCYNCYPPKKSHNIYNYRKKYFHKHLIQSINKVRNDELEKGIKSEDLFKIEFQDQIKIKEVFKVFNESYRGKAVPYKFFIAKIADLLELKHDFPIYKTKRNLILWNTFLEMKPFEIIEKKKRSEEYILSQINSMK